MIGFLSDWGTRSYYVGVAKAIIYSINPSAVVVDLSHEITPFNVREAMHVLYRASRDFPKNTVFLCVVDYGVGTSRKSIVMKTTNDFIFVGPDNGIFTLVAEKYGVREIREITNPFFMRHEVSRSFHGRDIFAPTAAYLDMGYPVEDVGPLIMGYEELKYMYATLIGNEIIGEVAFIDTFGNIETNIEADLLKKMNVELDSQLVVKIGKYIEKAVYCRTFGDVKKGQLLVHEDSSGYLEISINQGNAASVFKATGGEEVRIRSR